jgi:glycosyltransferase involved in cell wall biosynthesis
MFREAKRPDLLIAIARKLPQIRFVICGAPTAFRARPGYGEQIVKELRALPNVEYRGQLSPKEAREVISNAALFLSTSVEEGFPNTFLEAWSAGTPVVSMQCDPGGIIERFGLGTVPHSVDRTLVDLVNLTESPDQREQVATRVRQYIARKHGEGAAVSAFEEGLRDVSR